MAKTRNRVKRPDQLANLLHPTTRFFWGLALIGVLVLAPRWETRALVMVLGGLLATLAGKRISVSYFFMLAGTVVFFHALAPFGKVLFHVGAFPVTEGALLGGWKNGLTMAGLVFVSLGTISRELHLPGRFGELWALTFAWYERLMETRSRVHPRAILLSIDRILEHHFPTRPGATTEPVDVGTPTATERRTTPGGWLLMITTTGAVALTGVLLK